MAEENVAWPDLGMAVPAAVLGQSQRDGPGDAAARYADLVGQIPAIVYIARFDPSVGRPRLVYVSSFVETLIGISTAMRGSGR